MCVRHLSSSPHTCPGLSSHSAPVSSLSPCWTVPGNHIQYLGRNNILSIRSSSPISNSVTAMEIWLLFCLLMTFLPVLQFIFRLKYRAKPYTTQHPVPSIPPPNSTSNRLPVKTHLLNILSNPALHPPPPTVSQPMSQKSKQS